VYYLVYFDGFARVNSLAEQEGSTNGDRRSHHNSDDIDHKDAAGSTK
jgi:hypothetical protein